MPTAIVILTKFPDIFAQCDESIHKWEPNVRKIVVLDGNRFVPPSDWDVIQGPEKFNYAGNANRGWKAAEGFDILYFNDDVRLVMPVVAALEKWAYSTPDIGIVSPQFEGPAGMVPLQRKGENPTQTIAFEPNYLAFGMVFIPRRTIDLVGYMDETFDVYGGDDVDYCWQVRAAGLKLAVIPDVWVRHGFMQFEHSATARRSEHTGPGGRMADQIRLMHARLKEKWGHAL